MVGAYSPCAKFMNLCRHSGMNPLFLSVSSVGSSSLAEALGKIDIQLIVTQVVPDPTDDSIPIAGDYKVDLEAINSSASPGLGDFEGYIAARILTQALSKIQGPLTREATIDALEALGTFDVGLGTPLYLSPAEHQASHKVWPTILKGTSFVQFNWTDIKTLLSSEVQR
jgi:branched-chain amino acid transport system substrate-binding protein